MIPKETQFDGGVNVSTPATTLAPSPLASQESGAIGAASMNRDSTRAASPVAGAKPAKAPIDKSNWNRNVKVSQAQVDSVKSMGKGNMGTKAASDMNVTRQRDLTNRKSSPGASDIQPRKANAAEREAVKRVYPGAYNKATGFGKPSVPKSSMPFGGKSVIK